MTTTKSLLLGTVAASLLALGPALAADTMAPAKGNPEPAGIGETTPPSDPNTRSDVEAPPAKGADTSAKTLPAVAPEMKVAANFANMAAIGDMYENEAAKVAKDRSSNKDVQALADMIAVDHAAASAKLAPLVTGMGGTLPTEMDADHQAMIDALKNASDEDFDKTYLTQQVEAHKKALAAFKFYAAEGDTPALQSFAAEVAPKIDMHLQHAEALLNGGKSHSMN